MASAILADTSTKNRYADMPPEWRAESAAENVEKLTRRMDRIGVLLGTVVEIESTKDQVDRNFDLSVLLDMAFELSQEYKEIYAIKELLAVGVPAAKVEG